MRKILLPPIEEQKALLWPRLCSSFLPADFKDDVPISFSNKYLIQYRNLELVQIAIYTDANLARDSKGKTTFSCYVPNIWKRRNLRRGQGKSRYVLAVVLK